MRDWIVALGVGTAIGGILAYRKGLLRVPGLEEKVDRIADAIARAEGWYVEGSLPRRLNNPGSLKDRAGKLIAFATPEEGWSALKRQVRLILTGQSKFYSTNMTLREIARIYTGGDNPEGWAKAVSQYAGLPLDLPLKDVIA